MKMVRIPAPTVVQNYLILGLNTIATAAGQALTAQLKAQLFLLKIPHMAWFAQKLHVQIAAGTLGISSRMGPKKRLVIVIALTHSPLISLSTRKVVYFPQ